MRNDGFALGQVAATRSEVMRRILILSPFWWSTCYDD